MAFDGTTGLIKNMTNLEKKISVDMTQSFIYYKGFAGNNSKPEFQASGAYIFRPNGSAQVIVESERVKLSTKTYFVQVSIALVLSFSGTWHVSGMGIVYENTNCHGSETYFPQRKKCRRGKEIGGTTPPKKPPWSTELGSKYL